MRPVRQTLSASGVTAPVPLDHYISPFNVSLGCIVSNGATVNYKVQHTFDDVFAVGFDPSTATWFDHADITGETASVDGNYAFPVIAVRLNASTLSGGNITFVVTQAGVA